MPGRDVDSADLLARVRAAIEESVSVKRAVLELCEADIARAAEIVIDVFRSGSKLLAFGNGGSASDAQHLAAELAGRYVRERPGLPALALCANTSDVTAIGNDYGFDRVFARLIEAHGRPGDVASKPHASAGCARSASPARAAASSREWWTFRSPCPRTRRRASRRRTSPWCT
jgi:D-sedoheptulose 7-phosphate isomerase